MIEVTFIRETSCWREDTKGVWHHIVTPVGTVAQLLARANKYDKHKWARMTPFLVALPEPVGRVYVGRGVIASTDMVAKEWGYKMIETLTVRWNGERPDISLTDLGNGVWDITIFDPAIVPVMEDAVEQMNKWGFHVVLLTPGTKIKNFSGLIQPVLHSMLGKGFENGWYAIRPYSKLPTTLPQFVGPVGRGFNIKEAHLALYKLVLDNR